MLAFRQYQHCLVPKSSKFTRRILIGRKGQSRIIYLKAHYFQLMIELKAVSCNTIPKIRYSCLPCAVITNARRSGRSSFREALKPI